MTESVVQKSAHPVTMVGLDDAGNRQEGGMVGDAPKTYITNQEVEVATIQDSDSFAITGIGATVQINNLDIFDEFSFDITGAGVTDTISITTSKDGVNFSGTKKLCLNTLTGNVAASADMPTGDYVVPINCKSILVTMSGATDTHQFTWAARNAGRRRME